MDKSDIFVRLSDQIRTDTNNKLRNFSQGSLARANLKANIDLIDEYSGEVDTKLFQSHLSTATGENLDELIKFLGIDSRKQATFSTSQLVITIDPLSGQTVETLKDIIEEKSGTRPDDIKIIADTEFTNETNTIFFSAVSDVSLLDSGVAVEILSQNNGSYGNTGAGTITKFSMIPPELSYISEYLIITNPIAIDNASDDESDDNLRYRGFNAFQAQGGGNLIAIRLAALGVPGVADVILKPLAYGLSTIGVFVMSQSPIVSEGLLGAVREATSRVESGGNTVVVSSPDYIAIKLKLFLEFKSGVSDTDKNGVVDIVLKNVTAYINSLRVEEEFLPQQITNIAYNATNTVKKATILEIGSGDYNKDNGLVDYYTECMISRLLPGVNAKFVSNSKLLTVCW